MGTTEHSRLWRVKSRTEADPIQQLLKNREIVDTDRFFSPDYARDSHDPFLMPGMEIAISRLIKAKEAGETIVVYGDYDADGIPGTALLAKTFQANGITVETYIPDREKEGYGLNAAAIDSLKARGIKVIVTVDLGITASDEVAYAVEQGIDVIVTDHHEVDPERVPTKALAIVHPRVGDAPYPFGWLAGGGVAWKVAQALSIRTGKPTEQELKWWLELPAISTVCDIVPLIDENRMIVHYGLKVLMQTRNEGLKAMYRAGGIPHDALTERVIGYQIGPRLNAPGRVDHASLALELLLTDDPARATEIAAGVEIKNRERQDQLEAVVAEASAIIERENLTAKSAIVLAEPHWAPGVIGLAASRIVERYCRPTLLLGEVNGVLKGSGRTVDGFHLLDAILAHKDYLESYGGHEKAAGLALKPERFKEFQSVFIAYVEKHIEPESLIPSLSADFLLDPIDISDEFVTQVMRFAPFGAGNPKPRFVVGPLTVAAARQVGAEQQHLKVGFVERGLEGIAFRLGGRIAQCSVGNQLYVLGSLEFNEWNGTQKIQILVDDLKSVEETEKSGILKE